MKKVTMVLPILILFATLLTACSTPSTSYSDPHGNEYRYKIELTGTLPNAENELKLVILTNDNTLTFDKVTKSLYSSNSRYSNGVDYYLLPAD